MTESPEGDIRSMVGYEQRLWKMVRKDLLAEARRVGVSVEDWNPADKPKTALIREILLAQGCDDEVLK